MNPLMKVLLWSALTVTTAGVLVGMNWQTKPAPDAEEPSSREVALSAEAGQDEQVASDAQTQASEGESAELRDSPLQLHRPREEFEPRAPDGAQRADETGERPLSEDEPRSGGSAEAARSGATPTGWLLDLVERSVRPIRPKAA